MCNKIVEVLLFRYDMSKTVLHLRESVTAQKYVSSFKYSLTLLTEIVKIRVV